MPTNAYAAQSATTPLAPFSIDRREPLVGDVEIEILGRVTEPDSKFRL